MLAPRGNRSSTRLAIGPSPPCACLFGSPNPQRLQRLRTCSAQVRAKGLEPPRASAHRLLRPACLPIPPRPRGSPERSSRGLTRASRASLYRHMRDVLGARPGEAARRDHHAPQPRQAGRAGHARDGRGAAARQRRAGADRDGRRLERARGRDPDPDRLHRRVSDVRVLRRPLEPRRAADLRRAGGAAGDLRRWSPDRAGSTATSPASPSRPSTPACSGCSRC